ncbi:MAG: trehalose-phosphatase [Vicinamibacterales bacterium]
MFRILAGRHVRVLEAFAATKVVVAFDFDGTLAPLVEHPAKAAMRTSTRRLLTSVARLYPVAVISGRARRDVAMRIGAVPVRHVTGSHGLEPWGQRPAIRRLVSTWERLIADDFGHVSGVDIENKGYSLTVHYRHVRVRKARVVQAIRRLARALPGARALDGIESVAMVPVDGPNKGTAVRLVRQRLACDTAIFVGDDETDEDAFGADIPSRLLGIRVGASRRSRARYCLPAQQDIDEFLRVLVTCRLGSLAGAAERRSPAELRPARRR